MSGLQVMSAGMLTLIQDLGRFGVAQHGLSTGGPTDMHAHCWANKLLGNSIQSSVLEITMGNAAFMALEDMQLSLTGAETLATIDGKPLSTWRSFVLVKGQTLKLGYATSGFRAYLAVAGGFNTSPVFGSRATVMRNRLGGLNEHQGRPLNKGDVLPITPQAKSLTRNSVKVQWVPRYFIPNYADEISLSVIESYQAAQFSRDAKCAFYSKPYKMTDKSDRMGVRLQGNTVPTNISGIVSEGIANGAIQIPANGQPIILLNDRQTLGGYPKMGCISKMSLMKLAQARPGSLIHFYRGDLERETTAYRQFMRFFSI